MENKILLIEDEDHWRQGIEDHLIPLLNEALQRKFQFSFSNVLYDTGNSNIIKNILETDTQDEIKLILLDYMLRQSTTSKEIFDIIQNHRKHIIPVCIFTQMDEVSLNFLNGHAIAGANKRKIFYTRENKQKGNYVITKGNAGGFIQENGFRGFLDRVINLLKLNVYDLYIDLATIAIMIKVRESKLTIGCLPFHNQKSPFWAFVYLLKCFMKADEFKKDQLRYVQTYLYDTFRNDIGSLEESLTSLETCINGFYNSVLKGNIHRFKGYLENLLNRPENERLRQLSILHPENLTKSGQDMGYALEWPYKIYLVLNGTSHSEWNPECDRWLAANAPKGKR